MSIIDVGIDFYYRLVNRDEYQGDGKHNAVEFRKKYLLSLDSPEQWKNTDAAITLDFKNVKKIGPSFANEAFAYFTKYSKPTNIFLKIRFINLSEVQEAIIRTELESSFNTDPK